MTLNDLTSIKVSLNTLKQKGFLAKAYNPLYNYQTNVNLCKIDNFIIPEGYVVDSYNGKILKDSEEYDSSRYIKYNEEYLYATAGSLIDFDTEQLNFDLEHPVDIEVQPSYDGSVNLILNDNKNIPRLINSRFSVREKDTYEIVDRIGENDTNIYSQNTFDQDTSLYFKYSINPIIGFGGYISGSLPVGQYCFYLTYCDADDNESDFISETGVIPVFIGNDNSPKSIDGGIKNENSTKGVILNIHNIDPSYNYLKVYYIRYFADYQQNRVVECKKISRRYNIQQNYIIINITGEENVEELDPNIINVSHFNPKNILAQAQCKNMLFFGNITKNTDNYKELSDCALRIVPYLEESSISNISNNYESSNFDFGYYNSQNMYKKVGYANYEYYRFGVVFIYNDGTLSSVYNTLGRILKNNNSLEIPKLFNSKTERNYIKSNEDGWITQNQFGTETYLNNKGVCKFNFDGNFVQNTILGVKFNIPDEVKEYLKTLNIRGLFFVRQKRIPLNIAQCFLLPIDQFSGIPVIEIGDDKYIEGFVYRKGAGNNTIISKKDNYKDRLIKIEHQNQNKFVYAAICPDFSLNQPYYNQIFNGSNFYLQKSSSSINNLLQRIDNDRLYYESQNINYYFKEPKTKVTIASVTEDIPIVAIKDQKYRIKAGEQEEAYRFELVDSEYYDYDSNDQKFNANPDDNSSNKTPNPIKIARGMYSPFLAVYSESALETSCTYNIFLDSSDNIKQDIETRMQSYEPFYAISDRYNFDNISNSLICYRGDCYINTFSYRVNRNFNDPTLPNNDKIIQEDTWNKYKENPEDISELDKISRSDVNAVQLGSWITFKVRSSFNYALRSEDHSYVSEEAQMGAPRSFYPRKDQMWLGTYKMPDSYLYNDAYRQNLGYKCYFAQQDVNYIKNVFSNRIQYSEMAIQDSYKNNYRSSLSTYFRDYSIEYGSIQKLVGFEGYLLVVFEHGIGIAVINERILAGQGDGNPVFINTNNVLPEELTIISDTYGTQWPESVVKSENGYVYGVDTVNKKIWRIKGQQIEIISDLKVNKFLIDNISLSERDKSPLIGIRNVKSHYNNNKKDIMFTFYNEINSEGDTWNLCYNETIGEFITFYSWIPSYSANIDTQFFTFDRNTSKILTLLSKSNYYIPDNTGVLLDNCIIDTQKLQRQTLDLESGTVSGIISKLYYKTILDHRILIDENNITTELSGDNQELNNVTFTLENDKWGNYKNFIIIGNNLYFKDKPTFTQKLKNDKYIYLIITAKKDNIVLSTETVVIANKTVLNELTTDFYIHGRSGIFDIKENIYPTRWYGEYHPFEFEFVVNDKIAQQKIFNNLLLISNKAEPESFHFEIEGDNYEFSLDKRNMYVRQEATKELYSKLGSSISYNKKYKDVGTKNYMYEQRFRANNSDYENQYSKMDRVYPIGYEYDSEQQWENLQQQVKSSIFPLYYNRIDSYNSTYDKYQLMTGTNLNYQNLSGSEISWNRDTNQFDVITHIKNSPIDSVGYIRGNSYYKEGKWNIQIPSIIFNQKNEQSWENNIPPIIINSQQLPEDLDTYDVSEDKIPDIYHAPGSNLSNHLKVENWTHRKEARIRDKWMKVKIRYSGKNLAIIHSMITLYNISYS